MVHAMTKLMILLLMNSTSHAATTALTIQWQGEKSQRCMTIVQTFLAELRSMATDHSIEFDVDGHDAESTDTSSAARIVIPIQCMGDRTAQSEAIMVDPNNTRLRMRYLEKAQGFDSLDWVVFQKKYLAPEAVPSSLAQLAPQASRATASPALETPTRSEIQHSSGAIYEKWWFWALVATVGAGIYGATRIAGEHSRSNIEIR